MPDTIDFEAELALDRCGDASFRRVIGERWHIGDDRAFGGYGATLALAAALRHLDLPAALSTYAVFVSPLRFGPIEIGVEILRRGRSVAVVRSTAHQEGQVALSTTSWLSASPRPAREPVPAPEEPDRNWAGGQWPVLAFASRRGSGYPESATGFAGAREVRLWLLPDAPVHDQLFDVLVLDGHLLDAPLCALGNIDTPMASLDLSVTWLPVPAPPDGGWRVLRAVGDVGADRVSATGSLSWGDGRAYAVAATQALARR